MVVTPEFLRAITAEASLAKDKALAEQQAMALKVFKNTAPADIERLMLEAARNGKNSCVFQVSANLNGASLCDCVDFLQEKYADFKPEFFRDVEGVQKHKVTKMLLTW